MSRFLSAGLHVIDEVAAFWFQPVCLLCGRLAVGKLLCFECFTSVRDVEAPWCDRCGNSTANAIDECGECLREERLWARCRSLYWLNETTRELLHRIKYGSRLDLLRFFRPGISHADFSGFPGDLEVVPVPLHWRRWAGRGFNQAEEIAGWLAHARGWRLNDGLRKAKPTSPQSVLTRKQRQKNLRRAFVWSARTVPQRALLVDDVYTTGATLRQCARVLREAGCREVYAWTLFRAPVMRRFSVPRAAPDELSG